MPDLPLRDAPGCPHKGEGEEEEFTPASPQTKLGQPKTESNQPESSRTVVTMFLGIFLFYKHFNQIYIWDPV